LTDNVTVTVLDAVVNYGASCGSITESVDSICRDSADTQYMIIQKNISKTKKQINLYKP